MTPAQKRIRRKGRFISPRTDRRNRNRTTTKTRDLWRWLNDLNARRNHPPNEFPGRTKGVKNDQKLPQEERRVPRF